MKLYRCYNGKCNPDGVPGFDFHLPEGEPAKCPKCGVDKTHPRFGYLIVDRVQIHFDAPSGIVDGRGVGYIACDPEKKVGKYRATGSSGAVTCLACRESAAFKAAQRDESIHPDYEVTATIDLAKGTINLEGQTEAVRVMNELETAAAPPCGGCK